MVLAAALLEIKSKMLLPKANPQDEKAELLDDPRTELVAKLVEYKKFKDIFADAGKEKRGSRKKY